MYTIVLKCLIIYTGQLADSNIIKLNSQSEIDTLKMNLYFPGISR